MSITEYERKKQENIQLVRSLIEKSVIGSWAAQYAELSDLDYIYFSREVSKLTKSILVELDKQNY